MTGQLKDRIAIITGGAQGIGKAIAESMADAGANVIVGDMKPLQDDRLNWHELDVTSELSVQAFVDYVASTYGPPSILVNNAGIMTNAPLTEQSTEEWDRVMAINLRGPFLMAKFIVPLMRSEDAPAIVNIGSIEGIAGNPQHAAYMASKAGVHGLTVSMAIDLGKRGIRVNAIAPGWINTELNKGYLEGFEDQDMVQRELSKLHPVGYIGEPSDIGDTAVWLASPNARFITGQIIRVEGGRMSKLSLPSIFDSGE